MRGYLCYAGMELKRALKRLPHILAGAAVLVVLMGAAALLAGKLLSGGQYRHLVKHWKDWLNHKSKMQCLRTMAFPVTKETSVKWQIQWLHPVFLYRNHPSETLFLS